MIEWRVYSNYLYQIKEIIISKIIAYSSTSGNVYSPKKIFLGSTIPYTLNGRYQTKYKRLDSSIRPKPDRLGSTPLTIDS